MITMSVLLIIGLIGIIFFVVGLIAALLSMWMLFRKSDYDFVASRKPPVPSSAKKKPVKSSSRPIKSPAKK